MVLGPYGPQISENWPRTIRATVPQLVSIGLIYINSSLVPVTPRIFLFDIKQKNPRGHGYQTILILSDYSRHNHMCVLKSC
jgi:hypothetical protein